MGTIAYVYHENGTDQIAVVSWVAAYKGFHTLKQQPQSMGGTGDCQGSSSQLPQHIKITFRALAFRGAHCPDELHQNLWEVGPRIEFLKFPGDSNIQSILKITGLNMTI